MESQHIEGYRFDGVKRGRAVIICNRKYWSNSRYGYRYGAHLDTKRMKKVFNRLGFSVKCYENLTGGEMRDFLKKIAELEKEKPTADCFVCVISSHGEQLVESTPGGYMEYHNHVVVGVDDEKVETAELIKLFDEKNCESLKGKPKFFFTQACRGDLYPQNDEEGWDRGVKYQIKDDLQNKRQGQSQGQDTTDRQTSSSDKTAENEEEYDTSDAEADSDDNDEDYIFLQLSKQVNEAKEKNATQFADEKSGQITNSDIDPNENENQGSMKTPKSIHGTVGESAVGDTIDARNPNAKAEKSDKKERKKENDVSGLETIVGNSENVLDDVTDSLGIPAKKVPVPKKPVAKVPATKEIVDVISLQCFTDMLIMFASPPGKFALRSQESGSWMLTALYIYMKRCDYELNDKDFLSALLEISGEIAIDSEFQSTEKNMKNYNGSKTIPCISHMLRSDVYFDDEKLRRKKKFLACLRGSQ